MKNIAIFFLLIFCSCQLQEAYQTPQTPIITNQPQLKQGLSSLNLTPTPNYDRGISHDQFQARNLEIPKEVKKKIQIALFLPISGKNKELGNHLLNSALLSLFDNDKKNNLELVVFDSKDSPQEAMQAFDKIINNKIKIVIGPVFSNIAESIKEKAKKHGITAISLSNNHKLLGNTNNEGGLFLAGLMLESQIDQLVGYSMRQGKTNFAVIAPNNQFGFTVTDILKDTVTDRGGNFTASEIYEYNAKDLDKAVERVVNSFTIASHLAEGGGNKIKKNTIINESDRQYTQAILVPESGAILSKIAQLVKEANKNQREIKLIGTNQWDELSTLNDDNLIGSWFAAPETEKFRNFEKRYFKQYNKFPPRITSISYDLVNLLAKLSEENKGETLDFSNLTSGNFIKDGFDGIDGFFRFLPNGYVQRNLAILKVDNGEFEVIEEPVKIFLQY